MNRRINPSGRDKMLKRYGFDYTTGSGQKRLMYKSMGRDIDPDAKVDLHTEGDYGADPMGNGMFKMFPSGDVVDYEERTRRLSRYHKREGFMNKAKRLLNFIEQNYDAERKKLRDQIDKLEKEVMDLEADPKHEPTDLEELRDRLTDMKAEYDRMMG